LGFERVNWNRNVGMLIFLHGREVVLFLGFLLLLFFALLLGILIFGMTIIYRFLKNSKNEIQELKLTENEDKNS